MVPNRPIPSPKRTPTGAGVFCSNSHRPRPGALCSLLMGQDLPYPEQVEPPEVEGAALHFEGGEDWGPWGRGGGRLGDGGGGDGQGCRWVLPWETKRRHSSSGGICFFLEVRPETGKHDCGKWLRDVRSIPLGDKAAAGPYAAFSGSGKFRFFPGGFLWQSWRLEPESTTLRNSLRSSLITSATVAMISCVFEVWSKNSHQNLRGTPPSLLLPPNRSPRQIWPPPRS